MLHPLISDKHFNFYFIKQNEVIKVSNDALKTKAKQFLGQLHSTKKNQQKILSIIGNSPDWNYIEYACLITNNIHIPLNENFTSDEILTIIKDVNPDVIVYKKNRHFKLVSEFRNSSKVQLISIKESENWNDSLIETPTFNLHDSAVILYTSGSSSLMKGIEHSHQTLVNAAKTFSKALEKLKFKKALSYLPLSFSGERKLNYTYQYLGIDICYASTSKSLLDNILFFKPDIMALVPSLLELLMNQLERKNENCSLKYIVCGGAAIASELKLKYKSLGIKVIEVYGLTETASIGTINLANEREKINSVGQPLPNVDIQIGSNNEILIHSKTLLKNYLHQEIDWVDINGKNYFKTGDLGYFDKDNFLYITGRLDDQIKLQNGTWLMPQEIEKEIVELSGSKFKHVVIYPKGTQLNAIIITDLEKEMTQEIIDNFNNNGFIYINEIIVKSSSFLNENLTGLKFSRKKIIAKVLN